MNLRGAIIQVAIVVLPATVRDAFDDSNKEHTAYDHGHAGQVLDSKLLIIYKVECDRCCERGECSEGLCHCGKHSDLVAEVCKECERDRKDAGVDTSQNKGHQCMAINMAILQVDTSDP